jgi:arylformamidase
MSSIVDLTMPIGDHFRWKVDRKLVRGSPATETFQITWVGMAVHGFTHVDAPRHLVPNGATTSEMGLDQVVGEAAVVDLTDLPENTGITLEHLEKAGGHIRPSDIVLLRTNWDQKESYQTPEYWSRSPYMTRSACEWLLTREIKAIGYDFPQDYPIRKLLAGEGANTEEFVTHDILLRNGVIMIEYLVNLGGIVGERTMLYALPLKLLDADGAPARVIAVNPA